MNDTVVEKLNKILSNRNDSTINIINDKLTLSVFTFLQVNLKNVKEINFILKNTKIKDNEDIREFELDTDFDVNDFFFNEYDVIQKYKLKHFNEAKQMYNFIDKYVNVRMATVTIPSNILIVDDDFMILGSSSLEIINKDYSDNKNFNFDVALNQVDDKHQIVSAKNKFEEIWHEDKNSKEFKLDILEILKGVFKENTPEFMYYFTLHELFKDSMDNTIERFERDNINFKKTEIWNKLYNFQKDAVLSAIQKLIKYNGCIIADSVGLGKSYEALAVIKYFELQNDNVLLLIPAKLNENWSSYKGDYEDSEFKEPFHYRIMYHTDLTRKEGTSKSGQDLSRFNWSRYDLVVIDESHNFRNRNNNEEVTENRYSRLLRDVIKKGTNTKVLLISATPVNNSLVDLKNQISLITKDEDNIFEEYGINSIANTLKLTTSKINNWSKVALRNKETLFDQLPSEFYKLLEMLTISRSRKHILNYYKNDSLGDFPAKMKPDTYSPEIDTQNELLIFKEINEVLQNLNLSVYTPMKFIKSEFKQQYSEKFQTIRNGKVMFIQENREDSIKTLQKFNILKRLESSIFSFGETISRLLNRINSFIGSIQKNQILNDIHENEKEDLDDDLIDYKLEIKASHLNKELYLKDLYNDKQILESIKYEINLLISSGRDNKLKILQEIVENKIKNTPYNKGNKKILIFTSFADTAIYLYNNISENLKKQNIHTAMVTGSTEIKTTNVLKLEFKSILRAFSPKSFKFDLEEENEITVLIGTDCISEGQNLQDCDVVINYDIHWNPVSLIQRFGRIDRIGSTNKQIKMINFFPNIALNDYLNLEKRIKSKLLQVNIASTGDENILTPELNDLNFRFEQLEKLKEEVIELEEAKDNLTLTDLNMNEYLFELADFVKKTPNISKIPRGIYSVVENTNNYKSGIIFCFKHKHNFDKPTNDSSLYPYYLIYVSDDGEIIYGNNNSRGLLKLLRNMTQYKTKIFDEGIKKFLEETDDTNDMSRVTFLLNKAIKSIENFNEKESKTTVFDFSGFTNPFANQKKPDFELVNFFIIYPPNIN